MSLSEWSIRNSITIIVLMFILVCAGIYAYVTLPRESFPDITIPNIIVTTVYEGVAPSDIENLITRKIEKKVASISELEEIRSYSSEGISTIITEFTSEIDIETALQKVRDKVDESKSELPPDLEDDPVVDEINLSEFPIITFVVSGPVSLVRLKNLADDLSEDIESISGVLEAPVTGGLEREIKIEYNPQRLASYNLSTANLMQTVRSNNQNTPGGDLDIGVGNYLVKIPGEFETPEETKQLVIHSNGRFPVYITDLAEVKDGYEEQETKARFNFNQAITVDVVKRTGENIIRIIDEAKHVVETYRETLPPEISISYVNDQSKDIRMMVSDLENSILTGMILVLLVVLFAMGLRNALLVACAIPFSMLITFFVLKAMGLTLNMIVLFSLLLAVGMLVDNAIVIVENIYRHRSEGKGRLEAAIAGTHEVMWPVTASAATTIAAFLPMVFWPGIIGEFMAYLPVTVIVTLLASLFVALVINPTLAGIFVKAGKKKGLKSEANILLRGYRRVLSAAVDYPFFTLIFAVMLLVLSIQGYGKFGHGVEFFPEVEPKRGFVDIQMPKGTNLEHTDRMARQIEEYTKPYADIRSVIANVGTGGSGGGSFSGGGGSSPDHARIVVEFVDQEERQVQSSQVLQEIREICSTIYQAEIEVDKQEEGPPTGAPVSIELSGESYDVLEGLMRQIKERIRDIPGLVNLSDDYVVARPEIVVNVDKERAALLGLSTEMVAQSIKAAIRGIEAGVYREGNDEYDIIVQLPEEQRKDLYALRNLVISHPAGRHIPLSSVAEINISAGLGTIVRVDQDRVITIEGETEGRLSNDVLNDVQAALADLKLPRGYQLQYRGESEDQDESSQFLSEAFIAALMLIALILVAEFNSLYMPIIVLSSVVLSTMGVFAGLLLANMPFGIIMTGIGVISLAGIVVNNAIVLLDYNNQLRECGYDKKESLLQSGMIRFRPVILTAITTILGLIPMALGISYDFREGDWIIGSESAQWWGPMAIAVIFGLSFATMLTLIVIPAMVSMGDKVSSGYMRLCQWYKGRENELDYSK